MSSLFPVGSKVDAPAPGANTDIFATDLKLSGKDASGLAEVQVEIAMVSATVVNLISKPDADDVNGGAGTKATGQIQAVTGAELADADYFTLKDGTHTVLFEFDKNEKAVGTIDTVPGVDLIAAETFTLDDGVNDPVVFEFVADAEDIADPANVPIVFDGTETADEIRDLIIDAVNGAAALEITASDGGAATVDLLNDNPGDDGNTTSAEDVADTDFVVSNMASGGLDGVTGGRTAIAFDGDETAEEVAALIEAAVNGVGAGLTITATVNEDDLSKVDLENDDAGILGNIANTENVTDATFTVSGMTGGSGALTSIKLNAGNQIAAGVSYRETLILDVGRKYNLQVVTDSAIKAIAIGARS